jgi:uncharacterized cupin superfamily protein
MSDQISTFTVERIPHMPRVNTNDPQFRYDPDDPEGFRSGMFRPGPSLGAQRTGASVYDLPPGQAVCPYHYEYAEEEWAYVISGRCTLRTPEGSEPLDPGDLVFFPVGPGGAHQLRNDGDEPVRLLMFGEVVHPAATVYPDSDKVGVYPGPMGETLLFQRSAAVPYFHGE